MFYTKVFSVAKNVHLSQQYEPFIPRGTQADLKFCKKERIVVIRDNLLGLVRSYHYKPVQKKLLSSLSVWYTQLLDIEQKLMGGPSHMAKEKVTGTATVFNSLSLWMHSAATYLSKRRCCYLHQPTNVSVLCYNHFRDTVGPLICIQEPSQALSLRPLHSPKKTCWLCHENNARPQTRSIWKWQPGTRRRAGEHWK